MSQTNGEPRVYASVMLCDRVIRDNDGLLTAIKINTGYKVSPLKVARVLPGSEGALDEANALFVWQPLRLAAIITFTTEEPAVFVASLKIVGPRGHDLGAATSNAWEVKTAGGAEGHTLSVDVRLAIPLIGEYWFEVYVRGELATKTPMRVLHERAPASLEPLPLWPYSLPGPEGQPET